jgi:ubiquinone/menaquinone biosynthesis C-methylase UbiE
MLKKYYQHMMTIMPRIASFEKYSTEYDDWFLTHEDVYRAELRAVQETVSFNQFGVEIGIGTARFAIPLGITIGLDPSMKMAEFSKNRGIQIIIGVAEQLPFHDSTFDCVLMCTTLCFLDDVVKALNEAHRILRNHGVLVVGFIDKNSKLGRQYQLKKQKSRFYQDAIFYSVDEIRGLLQKTHFMVDCIKQTIIPGQSDTVDRVEDGYGKGSFVVIKALKSEKPWSNKR